jgi:type IV fimbrial biogenesis protein FimT
MKTTDFLHRPASASARSARGLTILEVTIGAALVAIMSAIAAPGMLDFVRNNRLSTAATQLDADILLARREAIERNARVLVCVAGATSGTCGSGTAWAGGWLVCYDVDQDGACDTSTSTNPNPIRWHGRLDSTLTLTGPSTAARFNANGTQGAAGAGSLVFTTRGAWTGSKSYVETVTATGQVSMTVTRS